MRKPSPAASMSELDTAGGVRGAALQEWDIYTRTPEDKNPELLEYVRTNLPMLDMQQHQLTGPGGGDSVAAKAASSGDSVAP